MKRYFAYGSEVSEQEAMLIEKQNQEYLKSADFQDWLKCEFIMVIEQGEML